jgi:hypothetical protein
VTAYNVSQWRAFDTDVCVKNLEAELLGETPN